MNDLEKRLAGTPLAPPPADWREAILAAAEKESPRIVPFPWRPVVWGALAACWVAIGLLNLSGPGDAEIHSLALAPGQAPTAPQIAEYLERRQLLLRWPAASETIFNIDRSKL